MLKYKICNYCTKILFVYVKRSCKFKILVLVKLQQSIALEKKSNLSTVILIKFYL